MSDNDKPIVNQYWYAPNTPVRDDVPRREMIIFETSRSSVEGIIEALTNEFITLRKWNVTFEIEETWPGHSYYHNIYCAFEKPKHIKKIHMWIRGYIAGHNITGMKF